jgi:hypothetical protein
MFFLLLVFISGKANILIGCYSPVDFSIASEYRLPTILILAEALSISCNNVKLLFT